MGTRSLTIFEDEIGREIAVMYGQYDGYPSGRGVELGKFLCLDPTTPKPIVNGFGSDEEAAFNGPGCLAAAVVSHFKTGIGNVYLHPAGTRDAGEEWVYTLRPKGGVVHVRVRDVYGGEDVFDGPAPAFLAWAEAFQG